MNRSTFCEIKNMNVRFFFKGQVYNWGWFRTPVPKLTQGNAPPPPPE